MSKETKFYNALHALRYNYPHSVSTYGTCCVDGCDNMSRGSGKCPDCCQSDIATITGNYLLAESIHSATRETHKLVNKALDLIEDNKDD